ncbi:hypothetical protein F5B20DRAFT_418402 [Whalleya microplaca]|nr:hypothetical protein F5B20DRAFT_418402 [Whalleya microplaca]
MWLNGLITGNLALNTMRQILNRLELLIPDEAMRVSYQGWKLMAPTKAVESKRYLDEVDRYVFVDLVVSKSADALWVTDWLIPILSSKSSKTLICAILHTIYCKHFGHTLAGAVNTFRYILEGTMKQLTLKIWDFPKDSGSTHAHGIHCKEATFPRNFIQLIDDGFSIGLSDLTNVLLDASGTAVYQYTLKLKTSTLPSARVVRSFLCTLIPILEKHQVPPLESVAICTPFFYTRL